MGQCTGALQGTCWVGMPAHFEELGWELDPEHRPGRRAEGCLVWLGRVRGRTRRLEQGTKGDRRLTESSLPLLFCLPSPGGPAFCPPAATELKWVCFTLSEELLLPAIWSADPRLGHHGKGLLWTPALAQPLLPLEFYHRPRVPHGSLCWMQRPYICFESCLSLPIG